MNALHLEIREGVIATYGRKGRHAGRQFSAYAASHRLGDAYPRSSIWRTLLSMIDAGEVRIVEDADDPADIVDTWVGRLFELDQTVAA